MTKVDHGIECDSRI